MKAYKNGKKDKNKSLHVEVWEAVNGPVPEGYVVHHIDHDKRNNDLSNLMVVTHQQHSQHHNQKHPVVKNCEVCGVEYEPHPTKRARSKSCSKECARKLIAEAARARQALSPETVEAIRVDRAAGMYIHPLAKKYRVSTDTLQRVLG